MKIVKIKSLIDKDGHLRVDVPTDFGQGDRIEVLLVLNKIEIKKKHDYNFLDIAGRFSWSGDAVAEQRRIRDEW